MSNLAVTLKGIRERSAVAPQRYKIINRDQLDALRESPEDVRTLLSIVDHVLQLCMDVREDSDRGLEALEVRDILFAMEDAVRPDITLEEVTL